MNKDFSGQLDVTLVDELRHIVAVLQDMRFAPIPIGVKSLERLLTNIESWLSAVERSSYDQLDSTIEL